MEEFTHAGWVRDAYPRYADAKADMQADWDRFRSKMPRFVEPFEDGRREAEYTLWSYLMDPTGTINHTMIHMIGESMASQWQMCQNAVALQEHMEIAIDLLLSPLDRVSPVGQFSDPYNDAFGVTQFVKPPVHGWAIKQIMKHHDLLKEVPCEKLELLYESVGRWGDWFMKYRDDDQDGLPAFEHGDETGFDDSTLFRDHMQVASPDLSAYLVLLFEAVGDLAGLLGKPEEVAASWYRKSNDLLDRMIDKMWDGERFVGLVPYTHERLVSDSFIHYLPIVLGNRLPQHIVNKIADDLSVEGEYLSPYGIATERINSDYFQPTNRSIGRGNIVPPGHNYICTGLFESSRKEVGILIAKRYCTALKDQHFPFLINPILGNVMSFHGGSWPACAYTIICRLLTEELG
jgi:putative isomerase